MEDTREVDLIKRFNKIKLNIDETNHKECLNKLFDLYREFIEIPYFVNWNKISKDYIIQCQMIEAFYDEQCKIYQVRNKRYPKDEILFYESSNIS